MAEIEFILNGKKTIINCKKEDIMIDIINRFVSENGTFLDSVYFIYNGQQISNFLLSFNELAKSIDKEANKMSILVQEKEIMNNNYLIKSKEIIYPKCHKSCRIKFDNYKIKLYDCANLHIIDNIFLEQFEKCQNINESKIICDLCQRSKSETYNKQFYKCFICNKNFCPLCKDKHDIEHLLINYDKQNYICNKHNEPFIAYSEENKKNLCISCST